MQRSYLAHACLVAGLLGIAGQLQQAALWQAGLYLALLGWALLIIVLIAAQAGFTAKNAKNHAENLPHDQGANGAAQGLDARLRGDAALADSGFGAMRRLGLLCLACAVLGFAYTGWRATQRQQAQLPPALGRLDVQLQGRVLDLPQRIGGDTRFLFAPDAQQPAALAAALPADVRGRMPAQMQLTWYAEQKQLPPLPAEGLQAGQHWQLTLRLKPIHGSINPHAWDYELWAFERGIGAGGYVRAAQLLDAAPRGWQAYAPQHWGSTLARWRAASRDAVFAQVGDSRQAAVLAALLMGEQSVIERSDWDLFRATGVAHLMSISGLHITLFAWAAGLLMGSLWRRNLRLIYAYPAPYAAAWGGLLLAAAYAAFTGWGVPAQRTVLMLALATLLRVSGRQWPWHFSLLLVAAVVLALDPWALLQAGFWLSFVAVAVLLLQNPSDSKADEPEQTQPSWHRRTVFGVQKLLREQWAISLGLAPLSLLLFGQFSLVGLLANLLAIPLVTLVITPLVLLGLLLQPLWSLAAGVLQLLLDVLQWCAAWPYAVLHSAALPWGLGAAAVLAALVFLALRQQQAGQWWQRACLALLLMLCVAAWRYQPARPASGQFDLLFADVGQGNAVLVQTARHSLLYDTGPSYGRAGGSDAGQRVLLPLLRALALQPDVLLVSHADSDHAGGAGAILQNLPPKQLLTSMQAPADWPAQAKPQPCIAGQRWRWDGVDFAILHPQAADYRRGLKSNAMSCVLRISNGQHSVLLAGDIGQAQERDLWLRLGAAQLASTVLLAPHHGSKTSSNLLFLQAVRPAWVVVQAGYLNRYGHPAPSVLARYADLGLAVRGTAECGAISWRSSQPADMGCLRRDAPRYWWHQPPAPSPVAHSQVKLND